MVQVLRRNQACIISVLNAIRFYYIYELVCHLCIKLSSPIICLAACYWRFYYLTRPFYLRRKLWKVASIQPVFLFATDNAASDPVIHYQQNIHMLSAVDDLPSLRVFGNGRVLVHYPAYMKKAGDYEMQLNDAELVNLIQSLSSNGVMDFVEAKVKAKKQAFEKALKAKGQFYAISDAVETIVNINHDEYQKNKTSKKIKDFHKKFSWKNIEHDANRYQHDLDITKANKAISDLKVLMKDDRLLKRAPR